MYAQQKLNLAEAKKTIALAHAMFQSKNTVDSLNSYLSELLPGMAESKEESIKRLDEEMKEWAEVSFLPISS